jgi:SAM-dependent methyltransferase
MKNPEPGLTYRDGRVYDALFGRIADDIPFYQRQIQRYGEPVLELACGTGRITIPLAEEGVRIAGLDLSASMLALARSKAEQKRLRIDWIKADCRDFHLDGGFRIIFIPWNSISLLYDLGDLEACFNCVKEHLAEDGRFIVDFFNPRLDFLIRDPWGRRPVGEYDDPDGRGKIAVEESNRYDPATQINTIRWIFTIKRQGREFIEELRMRIYFPQELDALLHYNGFVIEHKYGDYNEGPFEATSPKQLLVCMKESERGRT